MNSIRLVDPDTTALLERMLTSLSPEQIREIIQKLPQRTLQAISSSINRKCFKIWLCDKNFENNYTTDGQHITINESESTKTNVGITQISFWVDEFKDLGFFISELIIKIQKKPVKVFLKYKGGEPVYKIANSTEEMVEFCQQTLEAAMFITTEDDEMLGPRSPGFVFIRDGIVYYDRMGEQKWKIFWTTAENFPVELTEPHFDPIARECTYTANPKDCPAGPSQTLERWIRSPAVQNLEYYSTPPRSQNFGTFFAGTSGGVAKKLWKYSQDKWVPVLDIELEMFGWQKGVILFALAGVDENPKKRHSDSTLDGHRKVCRLEPEAKDQGQLLSNQLQDIQVEARTSTTRKQDMGVPGSGLAILDEIMKLEYRGKVKGRGQPPKICYPDREHAVSILKLGDSALSKSVLLALQQLLKGDLIADKRASTPLSGLLLERAFSSLDLRSRGNDRIADELGATDDLAAIDTADDLYDKLVVNESNGVINNIQRTLYLYQIHMLMEWLSSRVKKGRKAVGAKDSIRKMFAQKRGLDTITDEGEKDKLLKSVEGELSKLLRAGKRWAALVDAYGVGSLLFFGLESGAGSRSMCVDIHYHLSVNRLLIW
ncbi:hypothetical protein ABW19_dt0201547 [Dactylella cylindrospora]|nr:hypothetical protein ABW19_dt0201547 [Dactylella cylindrospora]